MFFSENLRPTAARLFPHEFNDSRVVSPFSPKSDDWMEHEMIRRRARKPNWLWRTCMIYNWLISLPVISITPLLSGLALFDWCVFSSAKARNFYLKNEIKTNTRINSNTIVILKYSFSKVILRKEVIRPLEQRNFPLKYFLIPSNLR